MPGEPAGAALVVGRRPRAFVGTGRDGAGSFPAALPRRPMPAVVPFETAAELFLNLSRHYAGRGKPALRHKDRGGIWQDIPWDDLAADVRSLAAWLVGAGVQPGDRVALLSENRPEWAVTDLAVQIVGAATVAVYPTVPADQVAYIVRDSGARVIVASTGLQRRKAEAAAAEVSTPEAPATVVTMAPPGPARDGYAVVPFADALAAGHAARRDGSVSDAALDARARAVRPDDLSALIYTSGTTGEPKGVRMTHRNLVSNAHAAHAHLPVYETDVHLSFLPLSHAFERTAGYTTVLSAGAVIAYAESVDTVAKNLPEVRPTLLVSVPRVFEKVYAGIRKSVEAGGVAKRLAFAWAVDVGSAAAARRRTGKALGPLLAAQLTAAERLVFATLHEKLGGRLRFAVSGGAALPAEIGQFFEAAGLTIVEGYGLSETAPVLTANPLDAPVFGSVGHVLPGVTVAIRDLDTGRMLAHVSGEDYPTTATSAPGEILARGPNVMDGYWNRPDATAEVFDADGWFRTGDVGRFERGYLKITDRIKNMLVTRGGKNVYPGPIEERLSASPLVDQVVVVGEGRDFLTALVVPDPEALRAAVPALADVLDDAPLGELTAHPDARQAVAEVLAEYSRAAASHEKVRDFRFVPAPFTVDNGLLTPTLKPKRKAIEATHADLVEAMYADA